MGRSISKQSDHGGRVRGRSCLGVALVAGLTLALGASAQQADPTTVPGPTPSATAARQPSPDMTRIWWNRPAIVESLTLSASQRARMDELLIGYLEQRRNAMRTHLELRGALAEAVTAGDWATAEAAADGLGENARTLSRAESELTVTVMQLLDTAQRARLAEAHPQVLRAPWVRTKSGLRISPRRSR